MYGMSKIKNKTGPWGKMWTLLTKLQGLLNMDGGYSHLKIICIHFQIIWKWTQLASLHKPWGESPEVALLCLHSGLPHPCGSQHWQSPFFWELLRTVAIVYFTPEVQWESQRITTRLCGAFLCSLSLGSFMPPFDESKSKTETLPLLTEISWAPTKCCLCTKHLWQPTVHISSAGVITQQAMDCSLSKWDEW